MLLDLKSWISQPCDFAVALEGPRLVGESEARTASAEVGPTQTTCLDVAFGEVTVLKRPGAM